MKTITAKLAGMRKAQKFVIYPQAKGDNNAPVMVQSDRAIGMFDAKTGKGVLNWRGSNSKYGAHLNKALGAEPYQFPPEFVYQCVYNQPQSGDLIGASAITGPIYVA